MSAGPTKPLNAIIASIGMQPLGTPTEAAPLTMSSLDIAELTGKDHKNVIRDIRPMLDELGRDGSDLSHVREEKDARGYTAVFHLDRELTDTLLTGYSVVLRRKVIARWHELEAGASLRIPQTMAQALRLAADQAEQIEQQVAALALAAPKVEFHDRYAVSTGNKGVREVAKLLGAKERHFIAWLTREDGPMYRLAGVLTPKAPHMGAGRFTVKAGTAMHGEDSSHAYNQAKFTPKGVTWIAGEWGKRRVLAQIGGTA